MRRGLIVSTAFARAVRRLGRRNPAVTTAIREALTALEADAFAPHLRTHELVGDMAGLWS